MVSARSRGAICGRSRISRYRWTSSRCVLVRLLGHVIACQNGEVRHESSICFCARIVGGEATVATSRPVKKPTPARFGYSGRVGGTDTV
jgi:hypothetical protein